MKYRIVSGIFKLGGLTGFFTGIAITIILSQLGDLTGYESEAGSNLARAVDLLFNLRQIHPPSLITGLATIAIIFLLVRTRLKNYALILALLAVSAAVGLLGVDSIHQVGDSYEITGALPGLALPNLAMVPQLLLPAIAIGLIGLIQAAGVIFKCGLENQHQRHTIFSLDTLSDRRILGLYGLSLLFMLLATESNLLNRHRTSQRVTIAKK